jgi:Cu/Ag efflux pump CusA
MAVAIIFGLAVATMLTLVLVPVMYSLIDSFVQALRRLVGLGSEHAS